MRTRSNQSDALAVEAVRRDVDAMFKSAELCTMIRFYRTVFWDEESVEHDFCNRITAGKPRLESVAEHSWHLADMILLVGPRFPEVNLDRCLALAVLHDKLEIWCRDLSPLGRDGSGNKSFAFDTEKRKKRDDRERQAAEQYLRTLDGPTRGVQKALLDEVLEDETLAARFVRALDKLQVFVFLMRRKQGLMDDAHIAFNLRYARKFVDRAPMLLPYYDELCRRLLEQVANTREMSTETLRRALQDLISPPQSELPFENGS